MRKIVMLFVVLVIAFILLGAPYLMGMRAETAVLKSLQDQTYPHYRVTVKEYKRGWFHSDAVFLGKVDRPSGTTQVQGKTQLVPSDSIELEMKEHIVHGPILFANGSLAFGLAHMTGDANLTGTIQEQLQKLLKDKKDTVFLHNDTRLGFNESIDNTMSIRKIELRNPDGNAEFLWNGITIKTGLSGDRKQATATWDMGSIEFSNPVEKATVKVAPFNFKGRLSDAPSLMNSEFHFSLPSIAADGKDMKFSLENLALNTKTETKNKLFTWDFSVSLDKLQVNSQHYNASIIDFSVKNLNAAAMHELEEEVKAANDAGNNEALRTQAGLGMIMTLPKLVGQGSQLIINQVKSMTPDGEIVVTGNLTIPATKEGANPLSVLTAIEADFQLRLPKLTAIQILTEFSQKDVKKEAKEESSQSAPAEESKNPSKRGLSSALTGSDEADAASEPKPEKTNESVAQSKEKATQQVESWLKDGYLTPDNQSVTMKVTYSKGELQINGKKVQPGQ